MPDFSREITGPDGRKGPLGQAVFEAVAMYPMGQLTIGQVVAFGGFANAVKAGGEQDLPAEVDRKLLARIICRLPAPMAVQVLDGLELTTLAMAME